MFELFDEPIVLAVFLFIIGAVFGSFANVVIYRLPKGQSLVRPGSHCQSCQVPIPWYLNIPIFAWFLLRGKCHKCGARFSIRYPLVELIMASLFALAGYRLGLSWWLLESLIFIFGLVTVSFIDIDHMILPDKFTLSGIVIGLLGGALNPDRSFMDSFLGVFVGGGILWAVAYVYFVLRKRDGMGGGDIKLLAWIGALLGWQSIPLIILVSSLIGAIFGIVSALRSKKGMNHAIPFGPYLAGAALLYLLLNGPQWSQWYFELHGFR